ncbi:MAG: hypothetical protein PUH21_02355, partial [Prevotellaceae bacterium]|nr:hypothetical protein [Prevotellaceae bacterium]
MSEFSLILVLQKENKQNSNMTWQKYKLNLRNSHLLAGQPHQNTSAIFVSMKYFETIPDPRVLGRCKYRLCDILFIALATYV